MTEHVGYIDGTGTETWAHCSRGWLGDKRSKTQGGAESYLQAVKDLNEHMLTECNRPHYEPGDDWHDHNG